MELFHSLFGYSWENGLFVIFNLIIIESLLSIDNAAVLATMVMKLPENQRGHALKYGIIGAYVFRGICLLVAHWLIKIWWLKAVGGLYLLYLAYDYFKPKKESGDDEDVDTEKSWVYKNTVGLLGMFWATVALVEVMDLAFSIDNVFAAVAFTDYIGLIWIGVFIGILAMRFVAQAFVKLMEKFSFLETVAFIVIGLLGIKLVLSIYEHFKPEAGLSKFLGSEHTDLYVSAITISLFAIPVITSLVFNLPRKVDKV